MSLVIMLPPHPIAGAQTSAMVKNNERIRRIECLRERVADWDHS
jgi:hypothetical protein